MVAVYYVYIWSNYSDLTRPHPKWWFSKGNPLISGASNIFDKLRYFLLSLKAEMNSPKMPTFTPEGLES